MGVTLNVHVGYKKKHLAPRGEGKQFVVFEL